MINGLKKLEIWHSVISVIKNVLDKGVKKMVNFSALGMCFKLAVDKASPNTSDNIIDKTVELYKLYFKITKKIAQIENEAMAE